VFSRVQYQWIVATAFVLALFMDILDVTIVNVSLVKIAEDFKASLGSTTWIVLGYSLSLAIWIPVSGWVGDRFGTRRTFIFALFMFVGASLLCSQATTISELIGFRVLQGVGGGMLTPTGITLLFRAFPPEQRAKASTVLAIPTILAPASGPVLGGWLTDHPGWRWIFGVNIPIGCVRPSQRRDDDQTTLRCSRLPFRSHRFSSCSLCLGTRRRRRMAQWSYLDGAWRSGVMSQRTRCVVTARNLAHA
jgi:MFS family permease